jgi:hypothetical protein
MLALLLGTGSPSIIIVQSRYWSVGSGNRCCGFSADKCVHQYRFGQSITMVTTR